MNRLTYVGPQFIVDNEDQYPGRVVRSAESGLIEQIDGRQINIALMNASGVDVDMNGYWATAVGDFMASVSATYTYKHEEKATKNSPLVQNLAQYSSSSWARSEEHTSELQSLMRISYAVFCLKKKKTQQQ